MQTKTTWTKTTCLNCRIAEVMSRSCSLFCMHRRDQAPSQQETNYHKENETGDESSVSVISINVQQSYPQPFVSYHADTNWNSLSSSLPWAGLLMVGTLHTCMDDPTCNLDSAGKGLELEWSRGRKGVDCSELIINITCTEPVVMLLLPETWCWWWLGDPVCWLHYACHLITAVISCIYNVVGWNCHAWRLNCVACWQRRRGCLAA